MKKIRVFTLNLLNNPSNYSQRYEIFKGKILDVDADIILLQEVIEECFDELVDFFTQNGYMYHAESFNYSKEVNNRIYHTGNATFSKYPIVRKELIKFDTGYFTPEIKALHGVSTVVEHPSGVKTHTVNLHLLWSAEYEYYRQKQAHLVDRFTEKIEADIHVAAGDFNTTPNSDTLRFFKGETFGDNEKHYSYWIDTQAHRGQEAISHTTGPDLPYALETAKNVGISYPEELPYRRIDYVLVKGWQYGRKGSPLSYNIFDTQDISDHYGIYVDIRL